MDLKVSSTIGFERDHNPTLAIGDEDEFVAVALAALGPAAELPRHRRAQPRAAADRRRRAACPLAPRQLGLAQEQGALLVDVRTDQQFDDAHVAGSVCIPMLRAGFGSRLAWLADRDQETVFIGRDDDDGRRAGALAVAVGIRRLGGFLHGGFTSWRQERRAVGRLERVAIGDLAGSPRGPGPAPGRRARAGGVGRGAHPGLGLGPLARAARAPADLDLDRPLAVLRSSGQRAGPRRASCSGTAPSGCCTSSTAACRLGATAPALEGK